MGTKQYIPTFNELLGVYPQIACIERMKNDRPCSSTVMNVMSGVRKVCGGIGLSLDSRMSELTRRQIEAFLAGASEHGLSSITAWTYIHHLRGLVARWTRVYYAERGWSVRDFDLPVRRRRLVRYVRPERAVLLKVKEWYEALFIRADKRDWIAVTLMLEFAMRNGDAGRLRWSDFHERDGRICLCYTPHKTALTSGRIVTWPVHAEIWARLTDIRKKLPSRMGTHFQGLVLPGASKVFARLNREIRASHFFTGTHKCCYEFRKICIDHVYQKYGAEMASSISGDDIRTVTRYYADPSAVSVDGVRIVDLL